jgi:hypothetical protein
VQKYNKKEDKLTDYYFWTLENFDRKLTYICERPQLDIGCIEGEGADYRYSYRLTFVSGHCSTSVALRACTSITGRGLHL